MENEHEYTLRTNDRVGFDVEVWGHGEHVWLSLDPNSRNDERNTQWLSPDQAREVAAALLRFADKVEKF